MNEKAVDRAPSDEELDELCAKLRCMTDAWLKAWMADPTEVHASFTAEVEHEIRRRARGGHREVEDRELPSGTDRRTR